MNKIEAMKVKKNLAILRLNITEKITEFSHNYYVKISIR